MFASYDSHAFVSIHCCIAFTCWERTDLLALLGDVYCIFAPFQSGILGQVWCLFVSFLIYAVLFTFKLFADRLLYKKLNKDENTIQKPLQRKWTGPIDKDGKIHSV